MKSLSTKLLILFTFLFAVISAFFGAGRMSYERFEFLLLTLTTIATGWLVIAYLCQGAGMIATLRDLLNAMHGGRKVIFGILAMLILAGLYWSLEKFDTTNFMAIIYLTHPSF